MFLGHTLGWVRLFFGGLFMLLFWIALIAVIVLVVRALMRSSGGAHVAASGPTAPSHDNALAILRERYARGEITKEEYDRIRQDIT
jgi:putative membrane protein